MSCMKGIRSILCSAAAILAAGTIPAGCGDDSAKGPPPIELGQDPCAQCDMTIAEDRHSAAAIIRRDGKPTRIAFDDIGCLLDHMREHPEVEFTDLYVRSADTGAWLPAPEASYIMSPQIPTPMASGIAAYADRERAGAAGSQSGANVVTTWTELIPARRKHMQDLYGSPPATTGPESPSRPDSSSR